MKNASRFLIFSIGTSIFPTFIWLCGFDDWAVRSVWLGSLFILTILFSALSLVIASTYKGSE